MAIGSLKPEFKLNNVSLIGSQSNNLSMALSSSVFTNGKIYRHKLSQYYILWNSNTICVFYRDRLIFRLPEKRNYNWCNIELVEFGIVKPGLPILLFYGRNASLGHWELVHFNLKSCAWECYEFPNVRQMAIVQGSCVVLGMADGSILFGQHFNLGNGEALERLVFDASNSGEGQGQFGVSCIHASARGDYLFVGMEGGVVQILKVKRDDSSFISINEIGSVQVSAASTSSENIKVSRISAEPVGNGWIFAVATCLSNSTEQSNNGITLFSMQSGRTREIDHIDASVFDMGNGTPISAMLPRSNEMDPDVPVRPGKLVAMQFARVPFTDMILLYTGITELSSIDHENSMALLCHGWEENSMKLVRKEFDLRVEPSRLILDISCPFGSVEVSVLTPEMTYSYAAFYPDESMFERMKIPQVESVRSKPSLLELYFPSSSLNVEGVFGSVRDFRQKLGGRLFFDRLREGIKELDDSVIDYPPRNEEDFKRLINEQLASALKNEQYTRLQINCLLFYLSLFYKQDDGSIGDKRGVHLPASYEVLMRGYWHLDQCNFGVGISYLLHPANTRRTIDYSLDIVRILHVLGENTLAYQFVVGMGGMSMATSAQSDGEGVSVEREQLFLDVLLACGKLQEAFAYQRRNFNLKEEGYLLKRLLHYSLEKSMSIAPSSSSSPSKKSMAAQLIGGFVAFSDREEEVMIKYCRDECLNNALGAKDFLLFYLVQRGRFLEALSLYDRYLELGVFDDASPSASMVNDENMGVIDKSEKRTLIMKELREIILNNTPICKIILSSSSSSSGNNNSLKNQSQVEKKIEPTMMDVDGAKKPDSSMIVSNSDNSHLNNILKGMSYQPSPKSKRINAHIGNNEKRHSLIGSSSLSLFGSSRTPDKAGIDKPNDKSNDKLNDDKAATQVKASSSDTDPNSNVKSPSLKSMLLKKQQQQRMISDSPLAATVRISPFSPPPQSTMPVFKNVSSPLKAISKRKEFVISSSSGSSSANNGINAGNLNESALSPLVVSDSPYEKAMEIVNSIELEKEKPGSEPLTKDEDQPMNIDDLKSSPPPSKQPKVGSKPKTPPLNSLLFGQEDHKYYNLRRTPVKVTENKRETNISLNSNVKAVTNPVVTKVAATPTPDSARKKRLAPKGSTSTTSSSSNRPSKNISSDLRKKVLIESAAAAAVSATPAALKQKQPAASNTPTSSANKKKRSIKILNVSNKKSGDDAKSTQLMTTNPKAIIVKEVSKEAVDNNTSSSTPQHHYNLRILDTASSSNNSRGSSPVPFAAAPSPAQTSETPSAGKERRARKPVSKGTTASNIIVRARASEEEKEKQ